VTYDTQSWEQLRFYTNRLCLRTPTLRDADALYDLFGEEGLDGWSTEGLGPFILETVTSDPQVLGLAGLMIFDRRDWTPSSWANAGRHAQPELGWALIRLHWGHGYATEAAVAIRNWAHESRSIDQLVSLISSDNVRSQRVAERLGAVPTETYTPLDTRRKTVVWRHPPAR
jgi:RimJ/RimL family protein N-acetyltransferase